MCMRRLQSATESDNPTASEIREEIHPGHLRTACGKAWSASRTSCLMGQDIAEYGGAFKVTEGFVEQFGKERVRNTPLAKAPL